MRRIANGDTRFGDGVPRPQTSKVLCDSEEYVRVMIVVSGGGERKNTRLIAKLRIAFKFV